MYLLAEFILNHVLICYSLLLVLFVWRYHLKHREAYRELFKPEGTSIFMGLMKCGSVMLFLGAGVEMIPEVKELRSVETQGMLVIETYDHDLKRIQALNTLLDQSKWRHQEIREVLKNQELQSCQRALDAKSISSIRAYLKLRSFIYDSKCDQRFRAEMHAYLEQVWSEITAEPLSDEALDRYQELANLIPSSLHLQRLSELRDEVSRRHLEALVSSCERQSTLSCVKELMSHTQYRDRAIRLKDMMLDRLWTRLNHDLTRENLLEYKMHARAFNVSRADSDLSKLQEQLAHQQDHKAWEVCQAQPTRQCLERYLALYTLHQSEAQTSLKRVSTP